MCIKFSMIIKFLTKIFQYVNVLFIENTDDYLLIIWNLYSLIFSITTYNYIQLDRYCKQISEMHVKRKNLRWQKNRK